MKTASVDLDKNLKSCRICLTPKNNMSCLFNGKFLDNIQYCTGIRIIKETRLPNQICRSCQNSLKLAHKFKKMCILTEQICKNLLKNKIKDEPDESKQTVKIEIDNCDNNGDEVEHNKNIKKDQLKENFDILEEYINDNSLSDLVSEDNITEDFNVDSVNENKFNNSFHDADKSTYDCQELPIVKKEKCDYEPSEYLPIEYDGLEIKNISEISHTEAKHRTTKKKQVVKKRGPYKKKGTVPARRKKFKFIKLFCESCQLKFGSKEEAAQHRETVHKEAWSFMCEVCGKLFVHRGSHYTHLRTHRPPTHACTHCDYRTNNKYDLAKHLLIHAGESTRACVRACHTVSTPRLALHAPAHAPAAHARVHALRLPHQQQVRPGQAPAHTRRRGSHYTHLRTHRPPTHACTHCDYRTNNKYDLAKHLLIHAGESTRACVRACVRVTLSVHRGSHYTHLRTHRPPTHACTHCDYRTNNKYDLAKHLLIHAGESTRACVRACVRVTLSVHRGSHYRHLRTHRPPTHACTHCDYRTNNKYDLAKHLLIHAVHRGSHYTHLRTHRPPTHACTHCDYRTNNKYDLAKHLLIHAGESTRACVRACVRVTLSVHRGSHYTHLRTHRPPTHACTHCDYRTNNKYDLAKHLLIHAVHRGSHYTHLRTHRPPTHACTHCDYRTNNKYDLAKHLLIHAVDACVRACVRVTLSVHRGSHYTHLRTHRPPTHACTHCDYRTNNKYDLAKHLLIHAGESTRACVRARVSHCQYTAARTTRTCARTGRPRTRARTATTAPTTSIKKWQCARCPNSYHTASNLREHERSVHERLRRHACGACGKAFSDRTHLRRHQDSHDRVKRFECDVCRTGFSRRCHWKKHLLKQHNIVVPPKRPGRRAGQTAEEPIKTSALLSAQTDHVKPD
ncbi:zinc finger protein 271-like [Bicyclus anynana]|uniref:Zinc finger protein 271-like n=1 Tax=Bicyclus anynana TaxID=110368 RepID=A0ABM3M2S5_BICAN|nr:zinc finger protein 271-like [Bicyclus anynana]